MAGLKIIQGGNPDEPVLSPRPAALGTPPPKADSLKPAGVRLNSSGYVKQVLGPSGSPLETGGQATSIPFARFFAALHGTPEDPANKEQQYANSLKREMIHWAIVNMFPPTPDDSSPQTASKIA